MAQKSISQDPLDSIYSAVIHKAGIKFMNFEKIIAHPDDFREFCVFTNPQICNHYVSKQLTTLLPSMEK